MATFNKNFRTKQGITSEGNVDVTGELTTTGNITGLYLRSSNSSGDEGGEILLYKPVTNTTIAGTGVTVDVYQNRLRFFEQGGTARGYYLDITAGGANASTNLASAGGTTTNALTIGTGLSGTSFNGSAAVTIAIDSTVATLTGTQTLTNKTINGSNNTITNVSLTAGVTGTLPVANGGTGITSFGTGIATFLGTPSSANLKAAVTDETGSGALVFADSPAFIGAITFGDGTTIEGRMTSSGDTFYVQAGNNNADTTAKLNIARNGTTSATISQLNIYSDASTFFGPLTTTGTVSINTAGTGTINLGDGTITKASGSGFTFNSSLAAPALSGSLLSSTVGTALGTAAAGTATIPARADHVHPTTGLALLAGSTFTGQIQSTLANSTTTGGGQIYLNGATGNRIDFNTNGTGAPTFTTRSVGTKIVLYPNISGSTVDYAIGIENSGLWQSVLDSTGTFKWYAGTTQVASLSGTGLFTAVSKSFDIQHPTKPDMRLRYGSLEGPENGVYVRGVTKENIIELPEYWTGLVDENTITATISSVGKFQKVYVEKIEDNKVYIGGRVKEISYVIFGERKDIDKLTVEY